MSKTPLPHYRASAIEMAFAEQLANLRSTFMMFTQSVRSVIPSVSEPHWSHSEIDSVFRETSQQSMLAGRGPRFIAKYHLAESDQERQALLDSLPKVSDGTRTAWSNLTHLTAEYRWGPHRGFSDDVIAAEYETWYSNLADRKDRLVCQGSDSLLDLPKNYIRCDGGHIVIPDSITHLIYTPPPTVVPGRWNEPSSRKENEPVYLTMIGVPEMMGYAIIEHTQKKRIVPRYRQCLLWNQHELCWNITDHEGVHSDFEESVTRRFLEEVGMPHLEVMGLEEKAETYLQLTSLIKSKAEEWYADVISYKPTFEKRTVTLEGVMRLTFEDRRASFNNESVLMTPLDDVDENTCSFPATHRFDRIDVPEAFYSIDDRNYRRPGPQVSPYQERRMNDLIQQFLTAPADALVFETTPCKCLVDDD